MVEFGDPLWYTSVPIWRMRFSQSGPCSSTVDQLLLVGQAGSVKSVTVNLLKGRHRCGCGAPHACRSARVVNYVLPNHQVTILQAAANSNPRLVTQ
jgi:hypothetical protein